jgi:hypothetical protein
MTQKQAIYFLEQAIKKQSKLEFVKVVKDLGGDYNKTDDYLGLANAKFFVDKFDIFDKDFDCLIFLKQLITEYPYIKNHIS